MIDKKSFSELSPKESCGLTALITDCIRYEQLELSLPDFDNEEAVLYRYCPVPKENTAASVLIVYDMEDYLEVTAFTAPKYRCRGLFTALFTRFLEDHPDTPVCFCADGNSYDALKTLELLDCEYSGTQHLMTLDKRPDHLPEPLADEKPVLTLRRASRDDLPALASIHSAAFDMEPDESASFLENALTQGDWIWAAVPAEAKKTEALPIGMGITSVMSSETCLYGLAIHPRYQGHGFGLATARLICLQPEILYPMTLHVTEENEAAFALYRRLGFLSRQELMEYWY